MENKILKELLKLSGQVIEYCEELNNQHKFKISDIILKYLMKSIFNLYKSKTCNLHNDYIFKLKLSESNLNEVSYWLHQCNQCETYPKNKELLEKTKSISNQIRNYIDEKL